MSLTVGEAPVVMSETTRGLPADSVTVVVCPAGALTRKAAVAPLPAPRARTAVAAARGRVRMGMRAMAALWGEASLCAFCGNAERPLLAPRGSSPLGHTT